MSDLSEIKCVPCRGGEPKLKKDEIKKYLQQIDDEWKVQSDPDKIERTLKFDDFESSIAFVNEVAALAEEEGHHPNLYVHDYNKLKIEVWTHKIKGLHQNDFILASKIDRLIPNTRSFPADDQ